MQEGVFGLILCKVQGSTSGFSRSKCSKYVNRTLSLPAVKSVLVQKTTNIPEVTAKVAPGSHSAAEPAGMKGALTSALMGRSVSCDHMAVGGGTSVSKPSRLREEGRVSQK